MNIIFMGTPEFAVPCLQCLLQERHQVSLVVTQGDKPKGRGHQLAFPPVKEYALANHLPVFQPVSLKSEEAYQRLAQEKPDLIVVTAYGKILPQKVLDLPPYGCINIHASLLPRYRGAAPIQWAVINGETESGVTSMQMAAGLDTGDMLLRRSREIPPEMTAGELHDLLAQDGAAVLAQTLRELETGNLRPEKQDDALSTYAPMLTKDLGRMDWTKPASELHNLIRGLNPWPSVTVLFRGKRLKIHRTRVTGEDSSRAAPGTVLSLDPLIVACGQGALILEEVQYEGARRMTAAEFLRGHPMTVGSVMESNKIKE